MYLPKNQQNLDSKTVGAILLMGGTGTRFGDALPKQFHFLREKRIFEYALETFLKADLFDEILLVCHPNWIEIAKEKASSKVRVIEGGKTRQQSSYLGLKGFLSNPDIVLIHDAVRPFVTESILRENVSQAFVHGAVDTCIPSADTIVHVPRDQIIASIPPRKEYLRGQTPQTFRTDWILKAHETARELELNDFSDDCGLIIRLGLPVRIVQGCEQNLKITSGLDLLLAEQIQAQFWIHQKDVPIPLEGGKTGAILPV